MDKQSLKLLLCQGESVERIAKRFGKDPSTVSYWLKKHGLTSPYAEKHAAKGGIEREQLEEFVEGGMTIAEIAEATRRSKGTVRHWLRRYGLRTKNGRGTRFPGVTQAAKQAGLATMTRTCRRHGDSEFVIEGSGYYRCKRCRTEEIVRRRRKVKALLVAEAGGRCVLCGYARCLAALQFHHLNPAEKRLELSRGGTLSLLTLRNEVEKCVLLCANCHVEVEDGMVDLPLEFCQRIAPTVPQ